MPVDVPRLFNLIISGLRLRPSPALQPDFFYSIQPTLEISQYLSSFTTFVSTRTSKNLTGAGGAFVEYFVVPDGKIWLIDLLYRESSTGNSSVQHRIGGALRSYLSAQDALQLWVIRGGLWIAGPAEQFGMNENGNAADTAVFMSIHYRELDRV